MTISIGYKALDISISMPLDYRGMTRGLLGNFNGVTGDDFVLPDGTILASDLTDRQIYEDFGPQCKKSILSVGLMFLSFTRGREIMVLSVGLMFLSLTRGRDIMVLSVGLMFLFLARGHNIIGSVSSVDASVLQKGR